MSTAQSTRYSADMRSGGRGSPFSDRWLAAAGVAGPILYVVTFTVAGLVRPGYSPVHQAVSDLGVGSNPWMLNVPLVVLSALLAAFAIGFHRNLEGRWAVLGRGSARYFSRCRASGSPGPVSSPRPPRL